MTRKKQPTVAFVLSGGASLGAIQVGMLRALYERGIRPDLIVGTSAGALNGAYIASRPPGERDRRQPCANLA
jgi:NTE family protein